jgi:hypothetical protein
LISAARRTGGISSKEKSIWGGENIIQEKQGKEEGTIIERKNH